MDHLSPTHAFFFFFGGTGELATFLLVPGTLHEVPSSDLCVFSSRGRMWNWLLSSDGAGWDSRWIGLESCFLLFFDVWVMFWHWFTSVGLLFMAVVSSLLCSVWIHTSGFTRGSSSSSLSPCAAKKKATTTTSFFILFLLPLFLSFPFFSSLHLSLPFLPFLFYFLFYFIGFPHLIRDPLPPMEAASSLLPREFCLEVGSSPSKRPLTSPTDF